MSHSDLGEILFSAEAIRQRVGELGQEISEYYRNKTPLVVAVLRGAALFHADLIRQLQPDLTIDFIALSSYGAETKSSGEVRLIKDLESSIRARDVLVVEDIVDTGLTLNYLLRLLKSREPASLRVCALLSKPEKRESEVQIDYLGFEIPDRFVVGYGLDHDQRFRNLPYIAVLSEQTG